MSTPEARRPLASRSTRWAAIIAGGAVRAGFTADGISILSLVFAAAGSAALLYLPQPWNLLACAAGIPDKASTPLLAAGIDFVLEGLYATKKISRSEERGYHASEPAVRKPAREMSLDDEPRMPTGGGRKKYYN